MGDLTLDIYLEVKDKMRINMNAANNASMFPGVKRHMEVEYESDGNYILVGERMVGKDN